MTADSQRPAPATDGVTERRLQVGEHSTRYLEAGDPARPTVVLLHDGAWGGSSSTTWGPSIPGLAERFHVIAPDMLGFGGTAKTVSLDRPPYAPRIDHVLALLGALGIDRFHVVGCSFGGSVALRMLETDRLDALLSVTSISGTGGPWRTKEALSELAYWDGTRSDVERVARVLVHPFDGWAAHVDERFRWASEPGHYRAVLAAGIPLPEPLRQERPADAWPGSLAGVATPVMLVAGDGDPLLEDGWTSHLVDALPSCEVVVAELSHEPCIDQPDAAVPILLRFLSAHGDAHAESRSSPMPIS